MAMFLDSVPNYSSLYPVVTRGGAPAGAELVTSFGDRGCASSAELILPVGSAEIGRVVGWLHPAVLYEPDETPLFIAGAGAPAIAGISYLYVPCGDPGDVVRQRPSGKSENPYILWGFWRTRYFGPLTLRVSDWL